MTATIHAAWSPGEVRVAVVDGGGLIDYAIWRPGAPDGVGDIHRGRAISVVPAMAGAFVAIEGAEGFLPDSDGAKGLTEGAPLTVRVIRAAQGGKGPRLRLHPGEEGAPFGLLRRGPDPLRVLAARYPAAPILVDDHGLASRLRGDLGTRVSVVARAFDDAIADTVEALCVPEVTLRSGVRFSFHPTPALVAIDVDGGGALAAAEGAERRHMAANLAAIPDLARQIRLRDLSGAILIDFAGLRAKRRAALGPPLAAALATDPLKPRLLGFTALGFAEVSRPRAHAPLHEMLSGPHAQGLAGLRGAVEAIRVRPGARPVLVASPSVVAALQADPIALAEFAHAAGFALTARSDPSLTDGVWRIEEGHG